MHIELLKENLSRAVTLASRFTARKAQLPVLSHVCIEAGDDGIFMRAADLQKGIRIRIGGKVQQAGSLAVPGKLLGDLVRSLPMGVVMLAADEASTLTVEASKVEATIQGMSAESMPAIGGVADTEPLAVLSKELVSSMMKRLGVSLSKDISRPALTGVYWELSRGRLVTTDGFRLGLLREAQLKIRASESLTDLLIPGDVLQELVKVMDDFSFESMSLLYAGESQELLFVHDEVVVIGRVLSEEYPRYEAIIPKTHIFELAMQREELLSAVRLVSIFAQDAARMIRFLYEDGVLSLQANAPQVGQNRVDVEVESASTGSIEIAFNAGYVVDVLQQFEADRVMIRMSGPLKPAIFSSEGDDVFEHVIMPVRIKKAA